MKTNLSSSVRQEYIAKLTLMGVFLAAFVVFISWKSDLSFKISLFDLGLLGFATLRLGRMVAYDHITEPLRMPFAQTVPDSTGAGESVEPRGAGIQRCLGQMISCPICAGTWIAAILVYGLYAFPEPMRVFLAIMATIGAAEILNALIEALSWSGQLSRTLAGAKSIEMSSHPVAPDEDNSFLFELAAQENRPNGK